MTHDLQRSDAPVGQLHLLDVDRDDTALEPGVYVHDVRAQRGFTNLSVKRSLSPMAR